MLITASSELRLHNSRVWLPWDWVNWHQRPPCLRSRDAVVWKIGQNRMTKQMKFSWFVQRLDGVSADQEPLQLLLTSGKKTSYCGHRCNNRSMIPERPRNTRSKELYFSRLGWFPEHTSCAITQDSMLKRAPCSLNIVQSLFLNSSNFWTRNSLFSLCSWS